MVAVEGALVAPALVAPALVDGVTLVDGVAEAEEEEDDALARATMRAYQTRGVRGQAESEWPVWLLGPLQQSPSYDLAANIYAVDGIQQVTQITYTKITYTRNNI